MVLNEHFLKEVIPQAHIMYGTIPEDAHFSIDSRRINSNDIFVALKGTQTDGHQFIAAAFQAGACGCILSESMLHILKQLNTTVLRSKCIISVPDTFDALLALAQAVRNKAQCSIIAITGSVGKTSTKELLARIFNAHQMNVLVSPENQNTLLGIALTLLKLRPHHRAAIFEVGISRQGEMAQIADFLRPTHAIITAIGHCHMEGLGSFSDIAFEKRQIFKHFTEENIGILNGDQSVLSQVSYKHPIIKFGAKTTNQIQARKVRVVNNTIHFTLKMYKDKCTIVLPHTHAAAVWNILAATAVARLLDVPAQTIVKTIQEPIAIKERFEQRAIKGSRGFIIHDAYNANPESMKAALLAFSKMQSTSKRIVVLGDMLELGATSAQWHRSIGKMLCKTALLSRVILVGSLVEWTRKALPIGAHVDMVPSWQDAIPLLEEQLNEKALVLVKGSHGMQLEKLVNHFTE